MGDDDFTKEELEVLGEESESETEVEEKVEAEVKVETEIEEETETEVETKVETETTHKPPDDNLIPQSEFNKRVGEYKTKIDLLKSDPDAYYQKYPDEKLGEYKPKEPVKPATPEDPEVEGGKYDGWKFSDVFNRDPEEAYRISPYRARMLHDVQIDVKRRQDDYVRQINEESNKEVVAFSSAITKELFGKDAKFELDHNGMPQTIGLSSEEHQEVIKVLSSVTRFMSETGRGGGILEDAYWLMNKDGITKTATAKGAEGVIEATRRGKVKVIASDIAGDDNLTGYEAYEKMTKEEFADIIDRMPEKDFNELVKKAPLSLRKKHPEIDMV